MHPILFELGGMRLHSYGVLLAVGALLGAALARRLAPRAGLAPGLVGEIVPLLLLWQGRQWAGQVLLVDLLLYPCLRLVTQSFRGDGDSRPFTSHPAPS